MSGGESSSVAEGGAGGFRPPFTAMQWQELEHQALIYKYLVAGMAVPPDLVIPIRQSFDSISARFFHQSSCKKSLSFSIYMRVRTRKMDGLID